jgi:dTDP-4-dehydrorhamnose reductase
MIGSNIAAVAAARPARVVGTWHSCPVRIDGVETLQLNIAEADSWRDAVVYASPDVIVHNAASVELIGLETDAQLARRNVLGTINAIRAAARTGAALALVSSDWVFDGERGPGECYHEDDEPAPVNAYGRSKLESEAAVMASGLDALITRPANVYGVNQSQPDGHGTTRSHVLTRSSLAVRWLMRLANDETIVAPADIRQSPTSAWSYASQLCQLIEQGATGTYHTAGGESMDRGEYLRQLAIDFDLRPELVVDGPTSASLADMLQDGAAAALRVPHNTALCVEKAAGAVGPQLDVHDGHALMRGQLARAGIELSPRHDHEESMT